MSMNQKIAFIISIVILGSTTALVAYNFAFNTMKFVETFVKDTQLFAQTLIKYERLFKELKNLRKSLKEEFNLEKSTQIKFESDKISITTTEKKVAKILSNILSSKTTYIKKLSLNVDTPFPIIFEPSTVTVNLYLELGGLE